MVNMAKRGVEYVKGGIYHIVQRGNNKSFIFDDQLDKSQFLDIIKKVNEKYPFYLLYYVLMDNHYHLLIEMKDIPISKIMQAINYYYSKYYNVKYNRVDTIFGSRYKAFYIQDTKYLMRVISYIAENPVKANLVKNASAYKWSAHSEIISKQPEVVAKRRLLQYLGNDMIIALDVYMDLIKDTERHVLPQVEVKSFNKLLNLELEQEKLDVVIKTFCDVNGLDEKIIFSTKRTPDRTALRKKCAIHAASIGYTIKAIADYMKLSPRAVRMMLTEIL